MRLLLLVLTACLASVSPAPSLLHGRPPRCQLVYGIRVGPTGAVEKVLDAARCQDADDAFIRAFLGQLGPQLAGPLLELEISDCRVSALDGPDALGRVPLRRLSVQRSGLRRVSADAFAGYENSLEELDLSDNELDQVPHAIRNLTALARLDLSRNGIRALPQGAVFFHLLKLRHLDVSHNRLGYLDEVHRKSDEGAPGRPLPMAIFNLEPLREHIESIRLRSNNLSAFPEQFSRGFNRLRHLDVSNNNFKSECAEGRAFIGQEDRSRTFGRFLAMGVAAEREI